MEKSRWYDRGLELSVWAILGLVPLVFWSDVALPFEIPKVFVFRLFLYLAIFFSANKYYFGGEFALPRLLKNRVFIAVAGLVMLTVAIGTFKSDYLSISVLGSYFRYQGGLSYFHYFAFFWVCLLGLNRDQFRKCFVVAFVSFLLILVYGVLQKFGVYFGNLNIDEFLGRTFSTLGHPNYFGSYILLLLFPFVAWSLNKKYYWVGGVVSLLGLVNLFFTGSRASFFGLIVGLVLFVFMRKEIFKKWVVAFFAGLILLVGGLLIADRLEEGKRSVDSRFVMWPGVVEMIKDGPWHGYGPDTFSISYAPYMSPELLLLEKFNYVPDRAHNVVLQWFSDYGYIGGVVLLIASFWFFWFGFKNMSKSLLGATAFSSLVAIFAAHLFGFSVTVHLVYIFFLLAFVFREASGKDFRVHFKPILWIAMILGLVILIPNILTVSTYSDHPGFYHLSLAKKYSSKSVEDPAYYELAEDEFESALEIMPFYPPVYLEFGKFYHQYENFDESTEKFEYYLELAPENRDEQFYKANPEFYEVFDYLPPQNL